MPSMYYTQDSRNNFDAMRPVPVCSDAAAAANQAQAVVGQCQRKINISTNCYYGYHQLHDTNTNNFENDCEMTEPNKVLPRENNSQTPENHVRKRVAELVHHSQCKRLREEVQIEKNIEPETSEKKIKDEELLESLLWNTHGGHFYDLIQCL